MHKIESSTFRTWLNTLKDDVGRARIAARIHRLLEGLPGDVKPVGQGVRELRLHFGPGYRVYFYQQDMALVILLAGGDKRSQRKDIALAHALLQQWKAEHERNL